MGYYIWCNFDIYMPFEYDSYLVGRTPDQHVKKVFDDLLLEEDILIDIERSIQDKAQMVHQISASTSEGYKWRSFEEHMVEISSKLINCTIDVTVKGEDDDDFVQHTFRNGLTASSAVKFVYWDKEVDQIQREQILRTSKELRAGSFIS